MIFRIFAGLALAALGLLIWIRFAPSDPADWHVPIATLGDIATKPETDCTSNVRTISGGAKVFCSRTAEPDMVLRDLDAIATATPRTVRLAGSPAEGRITWVTRSRVFGFPDYTTAEATAIPGGSELRVLARQRFGDADFGANAARLRDWLDRLPR